LVVCGDFKVNIMTNNTRKYKVISLLGAYSLDYIVDFPALIDTFSVLLVDNIFLDRSRNNLIIEPYHNELSDHDTLMCTLCNPAYNFLKPGLIRIGTY
jgi:hypothetical protein